MIDPPDDVPPPSDADAPASLQQSEIIPITRARRGRPPKSQAAASSLAMAEWFVARHVTHHDGPTLRYWREDWYLWSADRGCYRKLSRAEMFRLVMRGANLCEPKTCGEVMRALLAVGELLVDEHDIGSWIGEPTCDAAPNELVACPNGLLDLSTLSLRPPTPRYFTTVTNGASYLPEAPAPERWLEFLHAVWPDDQESISTLQEWMGYLLTPDTRQQKIMMLVGAPRSGKGTIRNVIRALLGGDENVQASSLSSLSSEFGLAGWIGKPAAVISDARLSGRTDIGQVVERLLNISGVDPLYVNRKGQAGITTTLPTRLMILSNEAPRFTDASDALANRFLILEMSTSWLGREDHALSAKLLAELPGILLWAIEGWMRLRERGRFAPPASSATHIDALAKLASPIREWLAEECSTDSQDQAGWVTRDSAYKAYRDWCERTGHPQMSQTVFGRDLKTIAGLKAIKVTRSTPIGNRQVKVYRHLTIDSDRTKHGD